MTKFKEALVPASKRVFVTLGRFTSNIVWPATKAYGPPIAVATGKCFIYTIKLLILPLTIAVLTILTSTLVGQLLLASAALWIAVNIFRIDPLSFMKSAEGEIELPKIIEWVTPDFLDKLIKENPERLLELLDVFAG